MSSIRPHLFGVLLAMGGLASSLPAAEEIWSEDGRRLRGTLTLDQARLRFTPTEGAEIPLSKLTRIRFPESSPTPFRAGGGRRVLLRDGQRITGQLLGLNENTLTMRTAWAARIELPRAAVASLESLPGWRTVMEDDFREGFKAFKATGEPALTDADKEPRSVVLNADGQTLVYAPTKPLEAGRVGVNFEEKGEASGARWTFDLLFQQGERSRRVAVTVAGDGRAFTVDAGGLKGETRSVARTPGWHRLLVSFTKRSLRITSDDDVLWYNLERGTGGRLTKVTMRCHKPPSGDAAVRGAVAWTEFALERAVDEHPKPPVEPEKDEVRLIDDDQLFGRILKADRHALLVEGRFGKRSLPWTAISGCSFRRVKSPVNSNKGANVRIMVRSGLCPEVDVLEGVVTSLDEHRLKLRHALLGELTFERGRVRELRPWTGGAK